MMQVTPEVVEAVKIARQKGYGWEEIATNLDLDWIDLHSIAGQVEPAAKLFPRDEKKRRIAIAARAARAAAYVNPSKERNAAIYAARLNGETLRSLGLRFGLSANRVKQICDKITHKAAAHAKES